MQNAECRAAEYLKEYCLPDYKAYPAFEEWELELHAPPSLKDQL
ncbi:hypothetical protein [Chitinophaga pinensis]|nr:hypothetical protein [Chitinophaga pinensis]